MRKFQFAFTLAGLLLLLVALFFSEITLASQDYRHVLRIALTCCIIACGCFAVPVLRGPMRWRIAGVGLIAITIAIIQSFSYRMRF